MTEARTAKPAVDVVIVTMKFPVPSEAFCGVEVRALGDAGASVKVRTLLGRHPMYRALLADWQIDADIVTTSDFLAVLRGIGVAARSPAIAMQTLRWLVTRSWRRPGLLIRALALLPRMFDIYAECRSRRPDVLYLYWGHYPAVLGYMVKRFLPSVRVSMNIGAYDLVLALPCSVSFSQMADDVWTHARCNLSQLKMIGVDPDRVEVIYKGIDLVRVVGNESLVEKDDHLVVVVSRLEENKGVDDAIKAFALVAKVRSRIKLHVIGEGPDLQRLQQVARAEGMEDRVTFLGPKLHAEVVSQLRTAGSFLLLSRSPSERLPNALKEAIALGCVCVVSRSPGIEELTSWSSLICPVEPGDWNEAGRQLLKVLSPETTASRMADRSRGRQFIASEFDARRTAQKRLLRWAKDKSMVNIGVCD